MEFPIIKCTNNKDYPYVVTFKNRNCYGLLCHTMGQAVVTWFERLLGEL